MKLTRRSKAKIPAPRRPVPPAARVKVQAVLISGEHNLLRAFLRAWLMSRFDRMQVVAEAGDARQALEMVRKHKPALVLMDFDTLQAASLDFLAKVRLGYPDARVIIYFAYSNDNFAVKVIRAGAAGFVLKSAQSEDMEKAIRTVMGGGVYLSPGFLKSLGTSAVRGGLLDKSGRPLSRGEAEILKYMALGLSAKAASLELKIGGPKSMEIERQALMGRLGVKNMAGLVRYAVRHRLVPA